MRREYKNGYLGKLQYWASEYSKAVNAGKVIAMDRALRKLTYFNEKHGDWLLAQRDVEKNNEKKVEKKVV